MRVLWASLHRPDAVRGGGWSYAYELLAEAATRHEITLVTLAAAGEAPLELDALGIDVVPVRCEPRPMPRNRLHLLARAAAGPGTIGFWLVAPCVEAIARAVVAVEDRRPIDVVNVFAGELAPVLAVTRAPAALLLGDAYSRQGAREIAHAPNLRQLLLRALQAAHARRWERTRYPAADAIACVSEDDAAVARTITRQNQVDVIPPPIGPAFFAPPDRARTDGLIAFIAALDYRPNVDALLWLLAQVWPRVLKRAPKARLRVVGRDALPEVRAAIDAAGVELRPDVPDARPEYWEAAVVAIPLRLGSGVKTKTLHAIACGAPLVGTPVAFEGIPVQHGQHVLVAGDAAGFAAALVETLGDPGAAAARAARARPLAEAYRRERVADVLDRFWQRAAAQPRRD